MMYIVNRIHVVPLYIMYVGTTKLCFLSPIDFHRKHMIWMYFLRYTSNFYSTYNLPTVPQFITLFIYFIFIKYFTLSPDVYSDSVIKIDFLY